MFHENITIGNSRLWSLISWNFYSDKLANILNIKENFISRFANKRRKVFSLLSFFITDWGKHKTVAGGKKKFT